MVLRDDGRMRELLIELSGVPLPDAAGIATLVAVHEAARVRGVTVEVTGLQPYAAQLVAASGLQALVQGARPSSNGCLRSAMWPAAISARFDWWAAWRKATSEADASDGAATAAVAGVSSAVTALPTAQGASKTC